MDEKGQLNIGGYKVILQDQNGKEFFPLNINHDLPSNTVTVMTNITLTGEVFPVDQAKKEPAKVVKLELISKQEGETDEEMNKRITDLANKLDKENKDEKSSPKKDS